MEKNYKILSKINSHLAAKDKTPKKVLLD